MHVYEAYAEAVLCSGLFADHLQYASPNTTDNIILWVKVEFGKIAWIYTSSAERMF